MLLNKILFLSAINLDFNKGNMQFSANKDKENNRDKYRPNKVLVDKDRNLNN
jgi:hypothetical protein